MRELKDLKFLAFFYLDNTLYSGATKVFEQVDKKMTHFISSKLNKAKKRQEKFKKIIL